MKKTMGILLLLCTAAGPAWGNSPAADADPVGKPAPAFETTDLSGSRVSSREIIGSGKILVVNFWGLRCGACIEEIPHLNDLQDRYREKVEVFGVNADSIDAEILRAQIERKNLEFRYRVIPDPDFRMVDAFQMTVAPLTIVIDGKGIVRIRHENYVPGDEKKLDEAVRTLTEGKPLALH